MKDFVYIGDLHLGAGFNVRTGDPVADICAKLSFVKDYCNEHDCQLILGGDTLDKPTIPYQYVNQMTEVLKEFKYVPYDVRSNHVMLFNNNDNNYKTTQNFLYTAGVLKELTYIDLGEFVIHSQKPLKTIGKPQLFIYHGFLNQQDGNWCVMIDELLTNDEVFCCLGHDHVAYEPVQLGSVRVIRPGSFLRGIRNDDAMRVPNLVHIHYKSQIKEGERHFKFKMVPIKVARDPNEIFKTKSATISSKEKEVTYESIIDQILQSSQSDLGLIEALQTVATPDVVEYVKDCLNQAEVYKVR